MNSEDFVPKDFIINRHLYRSSGLDPTLLASVVRIGYPITRMRFIWTRWEIPYILNAMGLVGEGVEVGVLHGDYSSYLLHTWKGRLLHSVDPWRAFEGGDYVDSHHFSDAEYESIYQTARAKLARYGPRSRIVREGSPEASARFADGQLDFVFIDAQHQYEAVLADLRAWFPKVRPGGILSGHDYLNGVLPEGVFGVKQAVDEFAAQARLRVRVSHEPKWKSFFLRKPR
jgi:hypothetical protein